MAGKSDRLQSDVALAPSVTSQNQEIDRESRVLYSVIAHYDDLELCKMNDIAILEAQVRSLDKLRIDDENGDVHQAELDETYQMVKDIASVPVSPIRPTTVKELNNLIDTAISQINSKIADAKADMAAKAQAELQKKFANVDTNKTSITSDQNAAENEQASEPVDAGTVTPDKEAPDSAGVSSTSKGPKIKN